MSQAILISDNEVVNSLYEVNLKAYVDTNVTVKKSVDGAIKLIEQMPNVDVILCFKELKSEKDAITKLHDFLVQNKINIPVIVLGSLKENEFSDVLIINNKYDIRSMLRGVAKILQITAKDMALKQVPKYFPVPLKLFSSLKTTDSDIYFAHKKDEFEYEYFLIIEKNKTLGDSLKKYIEEGVNHLYVDARERLKFINKASAIIVEALEREDLTNADHIQITSQGMGIVAEEIFENNEVSTEIAKISHACIESIGQVVKDMPKLKGLLKLLMDAKTGYVYVHSVLTTYVASGIIKHMSWGSQEQQNKVAFALFFHDIYLIPIYAKYPEVINEEDFLFNENVEEGDKKIVIEHAHLASQTLKSYPRCPIGADMIITQHHGMTNGQGFAVHFKDDISPLSKVIIIAEDITQTILARLKAKEKDLVAKEELVPRLREKYKNHTYQKIIDAFDKVRF